MWNFRRNYAELLLRIDSWGLKFCGYFSWLVTSLKVQGVTVEAGRTLILVLNVWIRPRLAP